MDSGRRKERLREQRAAGGETAGDVLRRAVRSKPTLLRILAVVVPPTAVGVAFVPAPYQSLPGALLGMPAVAWLLRRDRPEPTLPTPAQPGPAEES
ncbi:hypothetical protein AB0D08_20515 [Kitasatospora sp. NPDC048540]|uniref:hypothetical protein n=1 Tax=unclassified Kitasatospora TaxID=2633591 RepID=UPI00053B8D63|nr:hypothetical protein [Kitasatospora sp. MBT63]